MQNVTTLPLGTRQGLYPLPRPRQVQNLVRTPFTKDVVICGTSSRRNGSAPLGHGHQLSGLVRATASEIIAEALDDENKRFNPASLLELLDQQGWGVTTDVTRKFSTKFANVTLEASWDDDPTATGRVSSRRLAVLAVHQEWLVGRSSLVGRLVDSLERWRPGYLPRELVDRVRACRTAGGLTPDSEALDAPSLMLLAALLVPGEELVALTDRVLQDTRRELQEGPAYRGRPDLVAPLDRGLLLLRASVVRSVEMALFRASHVKEALELEAELRRQRLVRQPRKEEASSGVLGMWFRDNRNYPSSSPSPTPGAAAGGGGGGGTTTTSTNSSLPVASARAANERLYAGQLAPEVPPWMSSGERARGAAEAVAGRSGPRGLPGGRVGLTSFRPLPGAALYGPPGKLGGASFGSSDRLSFSRLDDAVMNLLAKADHQVPAAALSTFARLHRTALLDVLSYWQWCQLVGSEVDVGAVRAGLVRGFYQPRCSHATSLKPAGPLQVARRTRIDVAPGPELESLRALARRRGSKVLAVVSPLAWQQVVSKGEWEYWREAYRMWDRYAPMPKSCRTASITLVLTAEQVPYVGILEAEAAGRAAAASVARPPSATSAVDDLDISSLTSMSSLDFDDAPLPDGLTIPGTTAAAAATTSNSNDGDAGVKSAPGGIVIGGMPVQTETTLQIVVPPEELRQFMMALLELLPRYVGEGTGAASLVAAAAVGSPVLPSGGGAAASSPSSVANATDGTAIATATPGEWLPADSTTIQIRYCPLVAGSGARPAAGLSGRVTALATGAAAGSGLSTSASPTAASSSRLPEELQVSCYELRWALGSATLTTEVSGPSTATTFSRINFPPTSPLRTPGRGPTLPPSLSSSGAGAAASALRWCAPLVLTRAQLESLVYIFTDLAQQLPDLYGIQPQKLVVPTLSPLERLVSAVQGAAASMVRAAGLLALLAVPLAAAIKAGGGDLDAIMRGAGPSSRPRFAAAAASTVRSVQVQRHDVFAEGPQRSTPAAEVADTTPQHRASSGGAVAAVPVVATAGVSATELAAVCRRLEAAVEDCMWLEVSGTPAARVVTSASGVLPRWLEGAVPGGLIPSGDPSLDLERQAAVLDSWPEFQLVVVARHSDHKQQQQGQDQEQRQGGERIEEAQELEVVGCRPVNAAARAVLSELPLAAVLRGRAVEKAVSEHLGGLTLERIEQGKATPGRFNMPYQAARFRKLSDAVTPGLVAGMGTGTEVPSVGQDDNAPLTEHAAPSSSTTTSSPANTQEQQQQQTEQQQQQGEEQSPGDPSSREEGSFEGSAGEAAVTTTTTSSGKLAATPAPCIRGASSSSSSPITTAKPTATAAAVRPSTPEVPATAKLRSSSAVLVLKLELHPSVDPSRHAVQGRAGKQQREFAQADVVVRPWYDSDSLLCWLEGGVQLPSLGPEMGAGLLVREQGERAAFLMAYDSLAGRAADGSYYEAERDASSRGLPDVSVIAGPDAAATETHEVVAAAGGSPPADTSAAASVSVPEGSGAVDGSGGTVLKPQQLSEQQLQEALQQLLLSLRVAVPEGGVRVDTVANQGTAAANSLEGEPTTAVAAARPEAPPPVGGRGDSSSSSL